jgi:hypothetical protein
MPHVLALARALARLAEVIREAPDLPGIAE